MIGGLVNLIVYLLVLGILYAIAVYVVDNFIPEPPKRMIKVVLVVVIALVAVLLLLDLVGVGTGLDLPKVTTGA
jgi:multisubunit Na+/H+ antiporter MnhC subunit